MDAPRADGGEWLNPKPATEPGTRRVDVDLGRGKSVVVMLPVLEGEVDGAALESMSVEDVVEQYGHLTGAGDVVWPAGLAFSRLLVHCPSFVQAQQQIFDKTLCFWTFFCSGDHSPKSDDVQDAREWVTGLYAKCCTLSL